MISNPIRRVEMENKGKIITLAAGSTFIQNDGSHFLVNCTADASFTPNGHFEIGNTISILNTGTHTISFDNKHPIQSGQRAWFSFNGTEFIGGV